MTTTTTTTQHNNNRICRQNNFNLNYKYLLSKKYTYFIYFYLLLTIVTTSSSNETDEWREDKYTIKYKQNRMPPFSRTATKETSSSTNGSSLKSDMQKKLGIHFPWLKNFNNRMGNEKNDFMERKEEMSLSDDRSSTLGVMSSSRRQTLYHVASWHHRNQTTTDNTCPKNDNNHQETTNKNHNHQEQQQSEKDNNEKQQQQQSNKNSNNKSSQNKNKFQNYFPKMSSTQKKRNLATLKAMFTHGYDSYIRLAFPSSELKPLSCIKGKFNLARIPCLTLIDTLDTLLILKNYTEFANAVELLKEFHYDKKKVGSGSSGGIFELDENVSLFETNIRVLGGLLSAHQLIVYIQQTKKQIIIFKNQSWEYDGFLLTLAQDIGDRFLPAFETETGIPYGTVNLKYGVPIGETTVASLAGGGTLSIEMELLSRLTGDPKYGDAAVLATRALFINKSRQTSLVGKHIDIQSGAWRESVSGIGSNSDSFYEYLLKFYALFNAQDFYAMFVEVYSAVQTFLKTDDDHWYNDVDMNYVLLDDGSNAARKNKLIIESLSAFWPGMQVMLGDLLSSKKTLNAFFMIREEMGFLPERFDFGNWKLDGSLDAGGRYPLRPELFESTYFMYRASGSDSWLWAADFSIHALEHLTKTECGYATIRTASSRVKREQHHQDSNTNTTTNNNNKGDDGWNGYFNKDNIELEDEMPSYFLAETIKYLYLMFDDDNVLHDESDIQWVFTTEAHPVHYVEDKSRPNKDENPKSSGKWANKTSSRKYWDQIRSVEMKLQKAKESSNAQQCCINNHHPSLAWKHALAFDGGLEYEVGYGTKLHHHQHSATEQLPVQDGLCRIMPHNQHTSSSSQQHYLNNNNKGDKNSMKLDNISFTTKSYSSFQSEELKERFLNNKKKTKNLANSVEVVTTNNGFFAKNDKTGESIEAAIIDGTSMIGDSDLNANSLVLVISVQKVTPESDPHWTVLVADWDNHVYRCTIQVNLKGTNIIYPCSTAMFGATEMSNLISQQGQPVQVTGEIILPDPINRYGCSSPVKPVDTDKVLLLYRGECSFEQKIRNFETAKAIIMLNNEPNHLFVMASSSPIEDLKDFETLSVLITEEDGRKLVEAVATASIHDTSLPEIDGHNDSSNEKEGILATVLIERQTSLTDSSSSKDTADTDTTEDENEIPNGTPNESDDGIDTTTTTLEDAIAAKTEKNSEIPNEPDDAKTTTKENINTLDDGKEDDDNTIQDQEYKWPLVATAPNLLHVLVEQKWGIQAYYQKSNDVDKEDTWSLFILQHDGNVVYQSPS